MATHGRKPHIPPSARWLEAHRFRGPVERIPNPIQPSRPIWRCRNPWCASWNATERTVCRMCHRPHLTAL